MGNPQNYGSKFRFTVLTTSSLCALKIFKFYLYNDVSLLNFHHNQ